MAGYNMQDLRELREETGVGLANTKKALEEAEGDCEEALQIIHIKGLKSLSKRGGRSAGMGLITTKITDTTAGQHGTLVEVNAKADLVVRTEKFINMVEVALQAAVEFGANTIEGLTKAKTADSTVKDAIDAVAAIIGEELDVASVRQVEGEVVDVYLREFSQDLPPTVGVLVVTDKTRVGVTHDVAMHIAAYSPEYLNHDEVPTEAVEKECETLTEAIIAEGKPEVATAKIVEGKMNGSFKENMLLDQPYAKDPKATVGKIVEAPRGKVIGFARLQAGE